jgi:siroheme synthase (precorrin-2 oxidase/ferrochelatase)
MIGKGVCIMHPMNYYETLRAGREELLRQAAQERLARQVVYKRWWQKLFQRERQRTLELKHMKGV